MREDDATVVEALRQAQAPGDPVRYRHLLDRVGAAVFRNFEKQTFKIDRYELQDILGRGGRGVVYRAFDPELQRDVAIKLLHLDRRDKEGSSKASVLIREARAIARLAHPNVVAVYDVGTTHAGELLPGTLGAEDVDAEVAYVVMELVEGETLNEWIKAKPRSWREVTAVFLEAGEGLAAAHRQGIIHRDFKPTNVVVGHDGRARVLDFGLARWLEPELPPVRLSSHPVTQTATGSSSDLSQTGLIAGTPAYMAPEQHMGSSGDPRVDQYGFCVSLYEALYGCRPFRAKSIEGLARAKIQGVFNAPERPPRIPRLVRQAIEKGLRPGPEGRFATMEALLGVLRRSMRPRWPWFVGAGVLATAAVGSMVALAMRPPDPMSCRSSSTGLASAVWNEEAQARIELGFSRIEAPFVARTSEVFVRELDGYMAEWVSAREQVCGRGAPPPRAGSAHSNVGPPEADALRCLESRRGSVRALVDVYADADELSARHAVEVVERLPRVSTCSQPGSVSEGIDPEIEARLATLRESGRYDDALTLARAGLAEAASDDARQQALWLVEIGEIEFERGATDDALQTLTDALAKAEAAHDDTAAAGIMVSQGAALYRLGRFDEALRLLDAAQLRVGDRSPELSLLILESRMAVAFESFDTARGFALLDQLREAYAGVDPAKVRQLDEIGAIAEIYQGDARRGVDALTPVVATNLERLGAEHPRLAELEMHLAYGHALLGDHQAFESHARRALAIAERYFDDSHPTRLQSQVNVGVALRKQLRVPAAIEWLDRVVPDVESRIGTRSQIASWGRLELSTALSQAGRLDDSRRAAFASAQAREHSFGPQKPATAAALLALADREIALGHCDRAAPLLDEALSALPSDAMPRFGRLEVDAQISRARIAAHDGRIEEAQRHLERAWGQASALAAGTEMDRDGMLRSCAEMEIRLGRGERASAALRELAERTPNEVAALHVAWLRYLATRDASAQTELRRRLDAFDDPRFASVLLARALVAVDQEGRARRMLEQLGSDDTVVAAVLEQRLLP